MGLNTPSEVVADLQIGPTTEGMVRLYVSAADLDLPMDFAPDEAEAIAEEILLAVAAIRGDATKRVSSQGRKRQGR